MSEPKKETVRIVLPPRRDGQPLASSPRETAMINLPPKPIQKPGVPESVSVPEGEPPAIPPIPKPPGMAPKAPVGLSTPPAAPKPPSIPGVAPAAPKPPSVVGVPPGVPKPPSFAAPPPLAPRAPVMPSASVAPAPKSPSVAGVPAIAPLSGESKKETAKVPPSAAGSKSGLPQASVAFQRKPGGPSSTSSSPAVTITPQAESEGRVGLMLGVLAIAAALVAVGVQVLMFL